MTKAAWTRAIIAEKLESWCPDLKGEEQSETYRTAVTLLSATWVTGPEVDQLVEFTTYPTSFVAQVNSRMLKAGLWEECGIVHSDHWDRGDHCALPAFLADVLVGQGLLVAKREDDQVFRYWAPEYAPCEISEGDVADQF